VANTLGVGLLSLIPFIGTVALVAGAVLGILRRRPLLFVFLLSPFLSECYVGIAGALRGQLRGNASLGPVCIFAVIQTWLILFPVYRLKGARLPASALALFCMSYGLFAWFVGAMAFADDWL